MLSRVLRMLRDYNGMTQAALAREMHYTGAFISLLEIGKRVPTLFTLEMYARRFGVPVSSIIFMAECLEHDIVPDQRESLMSYTALRILKSHTEKTQ